MAKIKKPEENAPTPAPENVTDMHENVAEGANETANISTESPVVAAAANAEHTSAVGNNAEVVVQTQESIPANVTRYFKRHPDKKELYFSKWGGVFTVDTPQCFLQDSVLYKNPFYKQ